MDLNTTDNIFTDIIIQAKVLSMKIISVIIMFDEVEKVNFVNSRSLCKINQLLFGLSR
jgi:hypothetical protein